MLKHSDTDTFNLPKLVFLSVQNPHAASHEADLGSRARLGLLSKQPLYHPLLSGPQVI